MSLPLNIAAGLAIGFVALNAPAHSRLLAETPRVVPAEADGALAALAAHGEVYQGQGAVAIRAAILALPPWTPGDGISVEEAAALETLLRLGRQLAYAEAVGGVI